MKDADGTPYYHHVASGVTQWDRPAAPLPKQGGSPQQPKPKFGHPNFPGGSPQQPKPKFGDPNFPGGSPQQPKPKFGDPNFPKPKTLAPRAWKKCAASRTCSCSLLLALH